MIEAVTHQNLEEVLPLIEQYQNFYQVHGISTSKNREFFAQFNESSPLGCQFAFRESGKLVGFATIYFTFSSTITAKVAVLNDLYTCHKHRGKGIARKLIEHCHRFAIENGATRLQWVTAQNNKTAQKLYDSMDTNKSTWHFYTLSK